jgi:hypothetical protein
VKILLPTGRQSQAEPGRYLTILLWHCGSCQQTD